MFTYETEIVVRLDGKTIGYISEVRGKDRYLIGYNYRPLGSNGTGQTYPTIQGVKDSLEKK